MAKMNKLRLFIALRLAGINWIQDCENICGFDNLRNFGGQSVDEHLKESSSDHACQD